MLKGLSPELINIIDPSIIILTTHTLKADVHLFDHEKMGEVSRRPPSELQE
jgi:hypothetical protein